MSNEVEAFLMFFSAILPQLATEVIVSVIVKVIASLLIILACLFLPLLVVASVLHECPAKLCCVTVVIRFRHDPKPKFSLCETCSHYTWVLNVRVGQRLNL